MDVLEEEYSAASESAREYIVSLRDDKSSVTSELFTLNFGRKLDLTETSADKNQIQGEVSAYRQNVSTISPSKYTTEAQPGAFTDSCGNFPSIHRNTVPIRNEQTMYETRSACVAGEHSTTEPREMPKIENMTNTVANSQYVLNPNAAEFGQISSKTASSIEQDLWRQLKRVEIPVFSGDKKHYQSWKAAFLACIDSAPVTGEYKLLQLRQYLAGEALQTIENLGHSCAAYDAAKERLERKFGGRRRQIAVYLEELERFRQVRPGVAKDIERFADLLDIALINLKEAGQFHELGDGSLYTKLQRKLPETMLANYHRWIFENREQESVTALRKWVIQEAEFQTIASETVHGLSVNRSVDTRTHFGNENQSRKSLKCALCKESHSTSNCEILIQKSVSDRWILAREESLCYRCLEDGHLGKQCPKSQKCGENDCRGLHHRLLHYSEQQWKTGHNNGIKCQNVSRNRDIRNIGNRSASFTEGKDDNGQTTMVTQNRIKYDFIGLRTVPVILKNGKKSVKVHALLDDASTKTYVNSDVAAELGLQGRTERVQVNVLNGQVETFETMPVDFDLQSVDGKVQQKVSAYTADRVTGNMAVVNWNTYKRQWHHLSRINFPKYATKPIVDILIGLDCADLHIALEEVRGMPGEPVARLTPLGWTCVGNPGPSYKPVLQTNFGCTYFLKDSSGIESLNRTLKKFWEVESVVPESGTPVVRIEEQVAMKTVRQSFNKEAEMYRVGIPWKCENPILPNNYNMALRRLENTEKKLIKSPEIGKSYSDCIKQYLEKGYVTKVSENERSKSKWFLPHFPVIRPEKDTTKTRIVFDAAAKFGDVSLNDKIYQGPKLQRELFDVLLRFRKHPVAIVCDIAEMYLRIGIAHGDKPYHRFLWRGMNQLCHPDIYEFDRVVFGVNSSPFLAQFVLQKHAKQYEHVYPIATETILKSTYMDDSMDSVPNEELGKKLYNELSKLLSEAGMHARKWLSNSSEVLRSIPKEDRKSEVDLDKDELPSAKTLGVWWLTEKDVFTFKENMPDEEMVYTKRNFLKKIATLFDPIGLLSPFTIRAKMLLQNMWTAGLEWDEKMNESLANSSQAWFKDLVELRKISVQRCLQYKHKTVKSVSLHTFVDASENAYGAVVYARYIYADATISTNIVAAKTRVAPTIATSIPRLELMGAVVGIRLTNRIVQVLEIPMRRCVFWSDSANVLWWIRGHSRQFKPFVSHRVGEIQSISDPEQWRYVPTGLNPADILSRGMKAEDLKDCDKWWKGPEFLKHAEEYWPSNKITGKPTGNAELKGALNSALSSKKTLSKHEQTEENKQVFVTIQTSEHFTVEPCRFSSWLKLKRVFAWINRFMDNCKKQKENRIFSELLLDEINMAGIQIIKETQRSEFKSEGEALSKGKPLQASSKLIGLNPRLDDDGLMRSDGRLTFAQFLSFDVRYPVILPRKGWVTKLIIKEEHEKGKHATGTNHLLASLSARYWIISGREAIREWEKECMECRRRKAKACKQIMAPLPLSRMSMSLKAFSKTAVDFGGPFITIQGRGKRRQKRYLCLFTCMATRAVHLEVAYGLDTDSFLNAFYRMVSRRGLPAEMFSDNGTNFKGADNELKSLVAQLNNEQIQKSIANKGIKWHFNPPQAPHFGGVHESMIKSAKRAIYAILGNADITDEELTTAVVGAEGLLNSRPLTYQTADPSDDVPLTPNHFLHGQIGGQFAPTSVDETDFNPRRRWRRVQELTRHFWHRWMKEWLPSLNARPKWFKPERDLQAGDVVLIISPDNSRGSWPLGRVVEAYPGTDGRVRVAKVQVGKDTVVRPVNRLCPLELDI